ncbi:disease resistance protein-like [Arabidopsis thaliana]|jgi:energy-coupling factor transporter ATP-binding protein EcfA2|uniref:ADP-ribosyl cyclase/cyclic ADP-ribose hydrolase n=1 Tax=Arabidopsis thaliana TaxID=3702 RepID=Q9FNJ2_ARATH|nr:Disease resistance protein (TIR-NBS-LRR class) family [Arabidopsis thaliana]AED93064.1 Disease resistance protein (TIR-NBS-LRR class) family [Arabidopsis thaliana]BAB11675.1 disease resistance protein-like [Arabidopsis thaliana]|eukprot:NP_197661.1 Disease resistance protein (TIR-NBS-LRR class) family [Arabidopsis thaliana]
MALSYRNWLYDVFPSFSGEDVRVTFLSHFLKELDRKLISVFKDNDIQRSQSLDPELKLAIRDSRIAIVVFSKNYAASSWCLDELLEIVKCKEEFGQIVIPVFYGLDPCHVRKQSGEFGIVFENTCQTKTDDEIQKWRRALTDVANILGFHSSNWDNEATMVEDIANDVLAKLNLTTTSNDFEGFVGIEGHIAKISLMLCLECKQVRMFGIWGPSGIGKTTIARALFSRISRHFQGSVFLDRAFVSKSMEIYSGGNVDNYNAKLHLQGKFLSEILRAKDIKISNLGVVGERLKHMKVLIFIDDLDDQVVLDALASKPHWFGCGSRIIVITKDKQFFRAHGIGLFYEVGLPSDKLALEMFSQSAFRQNSPPPGFTELASEVSKRSGNLPLALNVLGSHLRGRDKEDWIDMLPRLRKGLDGKIEKILRVGYDELSNKDDKAIFRLIACLFNGAEISYIKLLLADSNLGVTIGLKNLVDKSLIRIGCDTVEMHSMLQEMGREIVREQSIYEPGEREFLVDSTDILDVLNDNTGTKKVLGISFDMSEIEELHIHKRAFKRMPNLRFLRFYKKLGKQSKEARLHLQEGFDKFFPPKLKLLSWDDYPMRRMPSNFHAGYLVVLRMQHSKLEKLWQGVQPLTCLREMQLWGSKKLKEIPDLSLATNLETLYLNDCSSLVELPSSIKNLNKLWDLGMKGCEKLELLPTDINLKSLYRLDLGRCSRLKSFPDISSNISELYLNRTAIEEVPWWIQKFSRLKRLRMRECKKLKCISPNISKLKHLEMLDFSNCIATTEEEALVQQQSVLKYLIFPGGQVPLYFTYQATGSSLAIPLSLHQSSLSQQLLGFRACVVLDAESMSSELYVIDIKVCCRLSGKRSNLFDSADCRDAFFTPQMDSHLVIFDCCFPLNQDNVRLAELNNDKVVTEFHFTSISRCKITGVGVRFLRDCSLPENHHNDPNILAPNCGCPETEHSDEYGEFGVETKRSRKRKRITLRTAQETIDLPYLQIREEQRMSL